MNIRIRQTGDTELPVYATKGSAGMDIRALLDAPVILRPMERKLIPTGLYFEIPDGYEAQVRPRSGLAFNKGITCLNTPGTIDSDYRGEIRVLLVNFSTEDQEIKHNERIAQIVINKVEQASLQVVQYLNDSDRGEGGFGHTGTI